MSLHKPVNAGKQDHASSLAKRWVSTVLSKIMNCIPGIVVITLFGGACLAQEGLVIRGKSRQASPIDAEKIYLTACSAVEHELRINRPLRPQVTLVLGARENGAFLGPREIRLTKWDPYMFAQGVVFFAFDELLPQRDRLAMAKRAVAWSGSTVAANTLRK